MPALCGSRGGRSVRPKAKQTNPIRSHHTRTNAAGGQCRVRTWGGLILGTVKSSGGSSTTLQRGYDALRHMERAKQTVCRASL